MKSEINGIKNALTYSRKDMIMTGFPLNVNGIWEICQLAPQLEQIVKKDTAG